VASALWVAHWDYDALLAPGFSPLAPKLITGLLITDY
jgi:hypothetical protein